MSKNRDYFYRGKYCIEYFCKKLKEIGTEIINYEKREMTPLTDGENKKNQKYATYTSKSFAQMKMKKMNLKNTLPFVAITLENLEELLIAFAI